MIYFTSDLHFDHANIIQLANRPFSSVEEMNETLIYNWNKNVHVSDEIYILGDVSLKNASYVNAILPKLHGKKYLIRGNHDRFADQAAFHHDLFVWIKDYYELHYQHQCFILFHYPMEEWNHFFNNAIHLHGHQHNPASYNHSNRQKGLRRYDAGVDANDMTPVSIEEILAFFS